MSFKDHRPKLASVKDIAAAERITHPDKPEEGSPDWLLGRVIVDVEFIKREIKSDGELTRARFDTIETKLDRLDTIETKLDSVLRLAPTEREKAAIKWLIGVVVTAILARFGIDAVNMP